MWGVFASIQAFDFVNAANRTLLDLEKRKACLDVIEEAKRRISEQTEKGFYVHQVGFRNANQWN
jgi:hypothetical protein